MLKRFSFLTNQLHRVFKSQRGAVAAEYALLATLVAVIIIGAVTLFGTNVLNLYNTIASSF